MKPPQEKAGVFSLDAAAVESTTTFLLGIEKIPSRKPIFQHKIGSIPIVQTLAIFNHWVPHRKKHSSRIGGVGHSWRSTFVNFCQAVIQRRVAKPEFAASFLLLVKIKTFIHIILDHPIRIIFSFDTGVWTKIRVVSLVDNGGQWSGVGQTFIITFPIITMLSFCLVRTVGGSGEVPVAALMTFYKQVVLFISVIPHPSRIITSTGTTILVEVGWNISKFWANSKC